MTSTDPPPRDPSPAQDSPAPWARPQPGSGILPEWDQDIQPQSATYRRWMTVVAVTLGMLVVVLAAALAVMIVE